MTPETEGTLGIVLQLISAGGVTALLVVVVFAFYTGKVLPRSVVDEMLAHSIKTAETLATKITEGVERAVHDGIVAALLEDRERKKG